MIEYIVNWVKENVNVDDLKEVNVSDIIPSKKYIKKNVSVDAVETPIILYYNNKLLDGHNRYQHIIKSGVEKIKVVVLPELYDKIFYLDLIITEVNRKLFEKRIKEKIKEN
jgi:hypothetical protein